MSTKLRMNFKAMAVLATLFSGLFSLSLAHGTVVQCGTATCSSGFDLVFNGNAAGGGELLYDATTGDISLNTAENSITGPGEVTQGGGIMWTMGDGSTLSVGSLSGNADPILIFAIGATTQGTGSTFGFNFDLPIAIAGPINASSSLSYSLTAGGPGSTALIQPLNTKVAIASEVDTDNGLGVLNKGVDVGDAFSYTPGTTDPLTANSQVFSATNQFTGNLAYDLMSVQIDFSLSSNSAVGLSGSVSQIPVPLPPAVWLFGSGLLGLVGIARRRKKA